MPLYSQLLSNFPKDAEYNFKYGACLLFEDENKQKSLKHLEFATRDANVDPLAFYYLGRAYHMNFRFNDAIEKYKEFESKAKKKLLRDFPVERQIEMCENGKSLVRTFSQLFVLDRKEVNPKDFYRSYDLGDFGGKIIVKPEDFKTPFDIKQNERSIMFLGNSAKEIYFSSYGEKGENGKDIFKVIKLNTGGFSDPIRVEELSTPYDDDYPYLHPNGKVIYFSSKGFNSMGGYDIFKSEWNESTKKWTAPKNLEFPTNSPSDDILFITDANDSIAYFASPRAGSSAKIQVYKIRVMKDLEEEYLLVDGAFTPSENAANKRAKITVKDKATGELIGVFEANAVTGKYAMNIPKTGTFELIIESEGNPTQKAELNVPKDKDIALLKQEMKMEKGADGKNRLLVENTFEKEIENLDFALDLIVEKSQLNVNTTEEEIREKEIAVVKREIPEEKDRSLLERAADTKLRGEETPEMMKAKATEQIENILADIRTVKANQESNELKAKNIAKEALAKTNDFKEANNDFNQIANAIDINTAKENEVRAILDKKKELEELSNLSENLVKVSAAIKKDNEEKIKLVNEIDVLITQWNENLLDKNIEQKVVEKKQKLENLENKSVEDYISNLSQTVEVRKSSLEQEKSKHKEIKEDIARLKREISDKKIELDKTKKKADKEDIEQVIASLEDDLKISKKQLLKREFELSDANIEFVELDKIKKQIVSTYESSAPQAVESKKSELSNVDIAAVENSVRRVKADFQKVEQIASPVISSATSRNISTVTSNQIEMTKDLETQVGFQELTAEKYSQSASYTSISEMADAKETKSTQAQPEKKKTQESKREEEVIESAQVVTKTQDVPLQQTKTDSSLGEREESTSTSFDKSTPIAAFATSKLQSEVINQSPSYFSDDTKVVYENNKNSFDEINALSSQINQLVESAKNSSSASEREKIQSEILSKKQNLATIQNQVYAETSSALENEYQKNQNNVQSLIENISDKNDDNLLMAQFNREEIGFAKQNIDNLLEKAENTSDPIEKSKILEKANLEKQKVLLKQFETKVMLAKSAPETSVNAIGLNKNEIANYEREIAQAKSNIVAAEKEVAQIQTERESLIADSQSSRTQTSTSPREEIRTPRSEQTTSASIEPSGEKTIIPVSREISSELMSLSGESQLKVNDNSFINDDVAFSQIKSLSENPNYDLNWNLNDYINNSESAMIKVVKLENDAEKYKTLSSNLLNIARNTDDSEEKAALMQQSNELERRALVLENEALQLKQFSEKVSQKAFEIKLSQESGDDLTMEVSEDGSTVTQYTDRVSSTKQEQQQESRREETRSPSTPDAQKEEGESQTAKSAQKDDSAAESQERELAERRQEEQQISSPAPSDSQFPKVELTSEYEEIKQEIIATEEFQNWNNIKTTLDSKKAELTRLENSLTELEERSQQKLKKKEQKSIAAEIEELEQKRTPLKRTVENIEENLATLSQIYYQDYGFNFRDINSISEVQLDEYLQTGKVYTPVAVTAIRETQAAPTQRELADESSATQKSIPTTEEQTVTETPTEDVASNQEQRRLEERRTEEVARTETPQAPQAPERQQTTSSQQESRQVAQQSQTAQTLTSQEKSEVKSSADYARLLELYREAQEKRRKAKEQYDRAKQLERQAADAVKESENIMSNLETLATDEEKVAAIQRATQLEEQSQTLYQQAQEALALAQSIENEAISAESQEKAISQSIPTASLNKIKMVVQEEEGIIFPELADIATQSPQQTTRTTESPRRETPVAERREQRTETQQRTGSVDTTLPSFIANNLSGEPMSNLLSGEAFSINPTRNVYSDNNAIPIDAPLPEGVLYTVQVGAFRNPIPQDLFREFTPLTGQTTGTGITRYRAGFFKTFRNADAAKVTIRGFGYADAFVVALNNGESISIARAREIEQSSGVTEAPLSFEQGATGTPPPLINETGEEVASFTEINNIQGLMFTVQIGVFSRPVAVNQMQNADPLYVERRPNGYLRYTSGLFNSRQEAINYREIMAQRGYSDAFVTAFNNGQRITVAEAQNLVNQNVRMVTPTDLPAPTEVPRGTPRQTTTATGLNIDVRRGDANDERGMRSGVYRFNRATGQIVGVGEGGSSSQAYQEGLESMTRVADEESNAQATSAEVKKVRGLIFRVQIGAFREEIPTEMAELFLTISNLGVQFANRDDGFSVYTVGNFDTIDEARSLKDALSQKEGFEGVFVVAYYDNEQISIERAIEILSE